MSLAMKTACVCLAALPVAVSASSCAQVDDIDRNLLLVQHQAELTTSGGTDERISVSDHDSDLSCTDFFTGDCGFTKHRSATGGSLRHAFEGCCESEGYQSSQCDAVAGKLFSGDRITDAGCLELKELRGQEGAMLRRQMDNASGSVGADLDDTVARKEEIECTSQCTGGDRGKCLCGGGKYCLCREDLPNPGYCTGTCR